MKAGDGSVGQTSSRESWLSTPLSDPNAALWASITPPANPDLATIVRRRARAFSLDLLAQRLHLRFPYHFSTRAMARRAILGAAVAFGAAAGTVGYFAAGPAPLHAARQASVDAAAAAAPPAAHPGRAGDEAAAPGPHLARSGVTTLAPLASSAAPHLAATASRDAPEQVVRRLLPSADADEIRASTANAKRSAVKKRAKAAARRTTKARRARATLE